MYLAGPSSIAEGQYISDMNIIRLTHPSSGSRYELLGRENAFRERFLDTELAR